MDSVNGWRRVMSCLSTSQRSGMKRRPFSITHNLQRRSMIKTVERNALVWFSAQRMYDLVNDVAYYPHFLPSCDAVQVIKQEQDGMLNCLTVAEGGVWHQC